MSKRELRDPADGTRAKRRRDGSPSASSPPTAVDGDLARVREQGTLLWETIRGAVNKECVLV
jgi:hypothetical protein